MPEITNYTNYRQYLKDFYQEKKEEKSGFTYAKFSADAGLKSPNYMKLVMDGEKKLTPQNIIRFGKALNLDENNADYFEALVHFNQAKDALEKEYYQARMKRVRVRNAQDPAKTLKSFEFEMMSNWVHHVLMLMTNLEGYIESPSWIRERLYGEYSEKEIADILDQLETMGLLERDSSGQLKQTYKQIKTAPELKSVSAKLFYEGLLKRAIKSMELDLPETREFATVLVGLSPSQLPELRKRVREFMKDLNDWALEKSNPRQVYSLNFSGFPLTKKDPRWPDEDGN